MLLHPPIVAFILDVGWPLVMMYFVRFLWVDFVFNVLADKALDDFSGHWDVLVVIAVVSVIFFLRVVCTLSSFSLFQTCAKYISSMCHEMQNMVCSGIGNS